MKLVLLPNNPLSTNKLKVNNKALTFKLSLCLALLHSLKKSHQISKPKKDMIAFSNFHDAVIKVNKNKYFKQQKSVYILEELHYQFF